MKLESNSVSVHQSNAFLFEFLTSLENYEQLMPENTEKFEIEGDSFVFGLKGMPEIRLVLKESTPNSSVVLGAASSKMPFTLKVDINVKDVTTSDVQLLFEGDFNPMITMMVKKPLQKFIDTLISNIEKL